MLKGISPLQHSAAWTDTDTFTIFQLSSYILTFYSAFDLGGRIQDRKLKVTKALHSPVYYLAQITR